MTRSGRAAGLAFGLTAAVLATAAALAFVALRGPGKPATLDDRVHAVAQTLRCPACVSESVADSPAGISRQIRAQIAAKLRAGESPDAIRADYARAYGPSILLSPPKDGLTLVAWLIPLALLASGIVAALVAIRRWSVEPRNGSTPEANATRAHTLAPDDRRLLDGALASLDGEPE